MNQLFCANDARDPPASFDHKISSSSYEWDAFAAYADNQLMNWWMLLLFKEDNIKSHP